ncbi:MAG: hypothetical protein DCC49_08240 [Acidobacteria bacterium]|nr:MAG: hypothetical protein DCC49_08240 [Acidobacteriota bacterium]
MESEEYRRIAIAEEQHWWYVAMRQAIEILAGDLIPGDGGRFLDAGCGPGGNGIWMQPRGTVFGIDVMPDAIEFASENHPGLILAQASVDSLPFADDSFDALQSITIITHEAVPDPVRALTEYRRVLKAGGVAVIIEPAFSVLRREHDRVVHAVRRYRRSSLQSLAVQAGFEVTRSTYVYSFLYPVAFALAVLDRVKRPSRDKSDLERGESGTTIFNKLARSEQKWMRAGRNIPFGVSVAVVARKPA